MGCEGFTYYPHIQAMGAVCYSPADSTLQAKQKFMSALLNLRALTSPFSAASLDGVVSIDPGRNNDPNWINAGFQRGNWWRRRQPRKNPFAPMKPWRPPPSDPPPAPVPVPPPPQQEPSAPAPPPTTPLVPPDPNIYNWGNDRSNQIVGMDQDRMQCKSRGTNVEIFVLDTGRRQRGWERREGGKEGRKAWCVTI